MRYSVVEQEERYRRLRALGRAVDYAGRSFTDFDSRPFLEQKLPTLAFANALPRALEYGTGTGAGACYLAARGFVVDGIDIAPTAIELARKFAAQNGCNIRYEVQDICTFPTAGKSYDLIVDSFCLQRLVTAEQRRQALGVVHALLHADGYFILGTTLYREGRALAEDEWSDEQTGIVYRKLKSREKYEDLVEHNGEMLYPRVRRVRPAALRRELEEAGFCVLSQEGGRVLCRKGTP